MSENRLVSETQVAFAICLYILFRKGKFNEDITYHTPTLFPLVFLSFTRLKK